MEKLAVNRKAYTNSFIVAPGVWGIKDMFVNMYLIHSPATNKWVLVDAGLRTSGSKIKKVASRLFWPEVKPTAIILTHGHFDHVGSLKSLAHEWDVPVYAHEWEQPYLNGQSSYPPPDPTVGGGIMSLMSWAYPIGPLDVSPRLRTLPRDGSVPGLPGWTYMHTPGHAPGHISLFRKSDRVLIAGDALVTTKVESAVAALTGKKRLSGPPKYLTYDWNEAYRSVRKISDLDPSIIATGHGEPMGGEEMRRSLHNLIERFDQVAVPKHGRYVDEPATVDHDGVDYVPPSHIDELIWKVVGITVLATVAFFILRRQMHRRNRSLS
jgi:glyoxylase-like metal-dependent hydrolase (beta-lactamase superfamily II)